MHYNCLIVDDEIELSEMTTEYFQMMNVSCAFVTTGAECMQFLAEHEVDILLLDINLKSESGFELCKQIRVNYDLPILFISARGSDDDVLIALNIGGDDYLKKPYSLSILLAKVNAMLHRLSLNQKSVTDSPAKSALPIVLHEETFCATVDGKTVELKAREFALLKYLFEKRNTIVTKEELFQQVWKDTFFSDGTLNVHIRRLRTKIEENPNNPKYINTVWGTGYILKCESASSERPLL